MTWKPAAPFVATVPSSTRPLPLLAFDFEVLVFATVVRPEAVTDFDAALADIPQVIEAQRLFGDPDYLIRVVTADLAAYQRLYDAHAQQIPGVNASRSTIVLKQKRPRAHYPHDSHQHPVNPSPCDTCVPSLWSVNLGELLRPLIRRT